MYAVLQIDVDTAGLEPRELGLEVASLGFPLGKFPLGFDILGLSLGEILLDLRTGLVSEVILGVLVPTLLLVPVASGAVQGTSAVIVITSELPDTTTVETIWPVVAHSVPVGTGTVAEHTVV